MTRWQVLQQEMYEYQKRNHSPYREDYQKEIIACFDFMWGHIGNLGNSHMGYTDSLYLKDMNQTC